MPCPVLYLLLVSSVIALVIGPIVLVFVPAGASAIVTGALLLAYGAIGLWMGMKELERRKREEGEND